MKLFLSAVGLLLIFEGIPYFIKPEAMKNAAKLMVEVSSKTLRVVGFVSMITGLLILYLANGG